MNQMLIAGETIDAIVEAFTRFEITHKDDEMVETQASLEPEVAVPFRRALLRIESELLQQEADALTAEGPQELRTDDQRRHDALIELVERIAAARGVRTRFPTP